MKTSTVPSTVPSNVAIRNFAADLRGAAGSADPAHTVSTVCYRHVRRMGGPPLSRVLDAFPGPVLGEGDALEPVCKALAHAVRHNDGPVASGVAVLLADYLDRLTDPSR